MNPALLGVALAVGLGAVLAVSARAARTALLGLILAGVAGAFLADPLPVSLGLAARLVGCVLGGYLLWVAGRGLDARTGGSRLGWPVEVLVALAAGVVGFGSHGLGAPATGPAVAQAAGFALLAVAAAAVLNGRDALRLAIGLNLLVVGAILVRTALGGTPDPLEQLAIAILVAVLGGVSALVSAAARADGVDGFDLAPDSGRPARRVPDAHPLEPR